ncbi:hypothetical protein DCCM_0824 [Desulfocucumis palustris]|uniref:SLH domain-containing protein n=1 Tax=Desulfocucumis palustris TaxID=1898651 RepID=A0A2L2X932_9FIRM|nr:S-layer homology domain-containing protein [Desulfocucumis palustris]GBF32628.1 hypothetical protein DCCM_0824 [Desulfocucumis palustris]
MKTSVKKKLSMATVSLFTLGTLAFAAPALAAYDSMPEGFYEMDPTFIPGVTLPLDIADHWAASEITDMVNIKAVTGYPDGNFYPDKPVTRAELATAMANAMYLPKGEEVELPDVSSDNWAAQNIATAMPYLAAFPDGSFRPEAPITREEVAVAIVKAAGLDNKRIDPNVIDIVFKDPKTVSPDLKKLVAIAVDQKLLKGIVETTTTTLPGPDGVLGTVDDVTEDVDTMNIKAKDLVTRGEMCYLLDKARAKVGLGNQIAGGEEE